MNVLPLPRSGATVRVGTVLAFAAALVAATPWMSARAVDAREASADSPSAQAPLRPAVPAPAASASSDLLVVLDLDGRGYLAQHTLASEGALIVLALPGSVDADHVRFAGPERARFADAQRRRPGRVALHSGSAFARYRHRYADAAVTEANGERSLLVPSVPSRLTVENGVLARSSIAWVLPEGFELVSVGEVGVDGTTSEGTASDDVAPEAVDSDGAAPEGGVTTDTIAPEALVPPRGRWYREGRGVRFEQRGPIPIELVLRYRRTPPVPDSIDCLEVAPADRDACSPDRDGDGVPDRRDLCLPDEAVASGAAAKSGATAAAGAADARGADVGAAGTDATNVDPTRVDAFGCTRTGTGEALVLDGVEFRNRRSYLDVDARRLLDRLALALARFDDDSVHEIAVHGAAGRDRRLSEKRARAIRHYLILRGIGPGRLQAVGRGGASSVDGGASPGANRRVELRRLQPDGADPPAGASTRTAPSQ